MADAVVMWDPDDLIVAPATLPGRGVRAIVRLAGVGLETLLEALLDFDPDALPAGSGPPADLGPDGNSNGSAHRGDGARGPLVRQATLHPQGLGKEWGSVPVMVLSWPGPGGPIGGPLAEVQLPCSEPLVDAFVAATGRHGARLARGGEFTLRAFLGGRLDLLQAEAVLAVVDARSPDELSHALDRLAGGAGRALCAVRERLLDLAADVDAAIDFAEEHSPDNLGLTAADFWEGVWEGLAGIAAELAAIAERIEARDAGVIGRLPRVVLSGPPNIGKSSLFNALVGREAALVADEEGTTRDWLEAPVGSVVAGGVVEWLLVDTAGAGTKAPLKDGDDPDWAEIAGWAAIERAVDEAQRAEIVIRCRDCAAVDLALPPPPAAGRPVWIDVITRCDQPIRGPTPAGAIATSTVTGVGLEPLRAAVAQAVAGLPRHGGAAERMRAGVALASDEVAVAAGIAASGRVGGPAEEPLVADAILRAIDCLGDVTGATIGTDLLERIFSRHCIGK